MLLYIHIPFCAHKCGYCAFTSLRAPTKVHAKYMQALQKQLKSELLGISDLGISTLESIYIGGGTPSVVDSQKYAGIFELLAPFITPATEVNIEANPNSLDMRWCEDMRAFGVNRLSLGVQSFFEDKLRFLEREHSRYDIENALRLVKQAGIKHVSIDLLYGTPLDSRERLASEVALSSALEIDHLSAYSLTLEEGSRFYSRLEGGDFRAGLKFAQNEESQGEFIREKLAESGFYQYEVSNFARPYKSHHNLGYWESKEYLGVGAGAIGRVGGVRYAPHKELECYISEPLWREEECLSDEDLRFERLFLGLRSCVGIDRNDAKESKLAMLLEAGKVRYKHGKIVANDYFLADEIALYLA
ncbi:MAG: radical SAM family heme chaperone HemW [Wolinella sp.]